MFAASDRPTLSAPILGALSARCVPWEEAFPAAPVVVVRLVAAHQYRVVVVEQGDGAAGSFAATVVDEVRAALAAYAVRTPHCAAPHRDRIRGLESQPESHLGRNAVASESAVLAGPIRDPGQERRDQKAPRVMPGATRRKTAVFRRNGRSCVTPITRVAPG